MAAETKVPVLVTSGDATLHGDRWPGEGPPLVFLHAGVADRRSWRGVIAALAGREMLNYDGRGFGESAPSATDFRRLEDLQVVLDEQVSEPAWLVGSSMGGGLAIDAALSVPQLVAGLVLIAPAVTGAPEPVIDAATQAIVTLLEAADEAGDPEAVNRLEAWLWLDGPSAAEGRVAGSARRLFREMNRVVLGNGVPEGAGDSDLDAWGRLPEVTVPTVVASGDLDVPFLLERSRQLAEQLPNARYVEIPGMAHLPYLEAPTVVVDLVRGALREGA